MIKTYHSKSLKLVDELTDYEPRFNGFMIKKILTAIHNRNNPNEENDDDMSAIVESIENSEIDKNSPPLYRAVRILQAASRMRTYDIYLKINTRRSLALDHLEDDWKTPELLRDIPGDIQLS